MLCTTARKHLIPIDAIDFSFEVTTMHDDSEIEQQPEDGCYMRGLFIEAARCDTLSALPAKLEQVLDRLDGFA